MTTSLLDEISKAVDDSSPAEGEETEVVDAPETPEPETPESPEPEPEGEPEGEPEPEPESEGEPEPAPEGEEGEGEPEPEGEDAEKPAEKSATDAEKAEGEKEDDPVNDPIPEGVAGRTRQRIETLVGRVREFEQYKSNYEELVGTLTSTGASPEEFGQMVQYMRLVHSDDPQALRTAREALQAELRGISLKLGEPVDGVDFLADYPDLQTAVEAREITPEHAQEIAVARARRASAEQQAQARTQTQAQQQQYQQQVASAKTALNQLEQELRSDPQYQAKYEILVPALRESFKQLPPSVWASTFRTAYNNLKLPAAPAPAPAAKPTQQPLRPRQPAGQGARQPSSVLDAVNSALDNM